MSFYQILSYKFIYKIIFLGILAFNLLAEDDDFNVNRLPVGNLATKYDFVAVKLNQIFDTAEKQHILSAPFFEKLKAKRIVMVGESHTNNEHHQVEFQVIKGLVEAGQQVCIALEMFMPHQNQALQAFIDEKFPATDFIDSTGWYDSWGYNYRMYQSIFEYAREKKIKLYGVNIKRDYVSKVGRMGLKGLTPDELKSIPEIDTTHIEHRFLVKVYFTGSDALTPGLFNTRYQAQCLWDAAMAEGVIQAANENPQATIVLLAGSGHIAYNLGIGKIIQKRSGLPYASVIAVDVPQKKQETLMETMHKHRKTEKDNKEKKDKMPPAMQKMMQSTGDETPYYIVIRSLADFLWGVPDTEDKPAYPSLGVRLEEKSEKGFVINIIFPESIAEKNQLQKGDILTAIDGKDFKTLVELKKYLDTKNWDDPIQIEVLRENETLPLKFNLQWEKKNAE
ncbi:ChaN family lipoprotein [candidate division KSB1 bacterium]|nr:ChaN family lipoprotein [candidate division KSB1 bacterium]